MFIQKQKQLKIAIKSILLFNKSYPIIQLYNYSNDFLIPYYLPLQIASLIIPIINIYL